MEPFCSMHLGLKCQLGGLWAQPPCKPVKLESTKEKKKKKRGEQDGRGAGGCGVHLSPWIHQEYTFRHRGTCRTPAESGQEHLPREKNIQNHAKLEVKP